MNRPALRFLAVGFLVSALVLSGYRLFLFEPSTSKAKSASSTQTSALSSDEKTYKEKYEELLTKVELEKVTGESSADTSSAVSNSATDKKTSDADKKKAEAAAAAAKKKADEEAAKKKAEEDKVKKYTLVISPGDPTSTAVDQLASQGIIKDANEFTQFLSGNDYEMYIRDGSYEVNSSMTYEQIAKIITQR
ncbi:hypothetical protein ACWOFR_12645 [Carnobacterium gallinarum]|uniref:hypothetical protein n=1 Tax=Carnobacterium gallinarum TaxID=2749 RepID=UPI00054CDADE|nr:hypothetical protein [Carnobacterium gallinarum]